MRLDDILLEADQIGLYEGSIILIIKQGNIADVEYLIKKRKSKIPIDSIVDKS